MHCQTVLYPNLKEELKHPNAENLQKAEILAFIWKQEALAGKLAHALSGDTGAVWDRGEIKPKRTCGEGMVMQADTWGREHSCKGGGRVMV